MKAISAARSRFHLGVCIAAMLCPLSGALAQVSDDAAEPATAHVTSAQPEVAGAASSAGAAADQDIVVTGSRIQASGFTAPTPTSVISTAQIQSVAPTRVDDALRLIPAFSTTGNGVARALSSATVVADLRNVGAQRTLVLVDGRRHVATAPEGTVDLGVIPAILIERTEVVTGGASASWGSDAVSGVINLILKSKLQGVEGTVQSGISQYGDAQNVLAGLAAGTSFGGGRGHILIGGEYSKNEGIGQTPYRPRPWVSRGVAGNSAYAQNGLPATIYADDVRRTDLWEGGLITSGPLRGTTFLPGQQTGQFGYGEVFGNRMIGGTSNYTEIINPGGNLQQPVERYSAMARVSYEVVDNLTLFAEGSFARSITNGYFAEPRQQGSVTGNPTCSATTIPGGQTGNVLVPITNPYLSDDFRTRALAAGVTCFNFGRSLREQGLGAVRGHVGSPSVYRGVVGVEGTLGDWSFDAYYQYGRNHFVQEYVGQINMINYRKAIDAVRSGSNIVCRVNADANPLNDDPACAPLNLFGFGSPSQEAIAYITGTSRFDLITKQQVAAFSANGALFEGWAGPINAAFGAEYREESIDATVDAISQAGQWQSGARQPISGSYNVKEVFGELAIPLLKDLPFIRSFDLNLAARYTDYSTSGGVTTWKVGGTWELSSELRLRATRSRDIRAGNFAELFAPTTVARQNIRDPRRSTNYTVEVASLGNPNLDPEKADTLTAGIVYQPRWLDGLRLSVDYYDIDIKGVIGTISANEVLERCYVDGISDFCGLVTTSGGAPAGDITGVTVRFENLDRLKTKGVDFEAAYRSSLENIFGQGAGSLSIRLLGTYLDTLATTAVSTASTEERAGEYVTPHWRVSGLVTHELGRLTSTLDLRWLQGGKIDNDFVVGTGTLNSINFNDTKNTFYTNATFTVDVSRDADRSREMFIRLNNIFNVAPPFPDQASPLFDQVGRAFRVGLRFKM
ncbi:MULTISPECIES: TonB-dependent receptor plug domain-containing protein [unclassified Sphingobium]|uniref:TonB-dependent receptor plug domain-containing protein n=1 Tax=unclassified Sphingobium TaxID=2611147 RepID=UPI002224DB61|nr:MULTISPECIES: TonB-dependent receptor [unclassified Sphingobium]MCW2395944.1 outer membrane receptor protein involved in Fe transport [Sphingobium sp. B8D3B]MCW2419460.1 outer membrane receptor protein involved in Fe transport [Sphingobium sp. B8D3C]